MIRDRRTYDKRPTTEYSILSREHYHDLVNFQQHLLNHSPECLLREHIVLAGWEVNTRSPELQHAPSGAVHAVVVDTQLARQIASGGAAQHVIRNKAVASLVSVNGACLVALNIGNHVLDFSSWSDEAFSG